MYQKIIHYHIAKTGGTSLNRWLDTLVPASRARPGENGAAFSGAWKRQLTPRLTRDVLLCDAGSLQSPDLGGKPFSYPPLEALKRQVSHCAQTLVQNVVHNVGHFMMHCEMARDAFSKWDVIHDHSPAIVTTDPAHYRFVVFRDPTSRFLSFLRDWRRCSEDDLANAPAEWRDIRNGARTLPADEWIKLFERNPMLMVLASQTYAMKSAAVYALSGDDLRCAGNSDIEVARYALHNLFHYVGVTEHLDVVANCVARDVGAAPVGGLGRHNRGAADAVKDTLSERSLDTLRAYWGDDYEIYELAKKRFSQLSEMSYDERDFEQQHLRRRLTRLVPRTTGSMREFSLSDQIVGSGFPGREVGESAIRIQPASRVVLYMPIEPLEDAEVILDIDGPLDSATAGDLRMIVDGSAVAYRREAMSSTVARLTVPVATTKPFCKIEIVFDGTATQGAVESEAGYRGLRLRRYGYSLRRLAAGGSTAPLAGSAIGGKCLVPADDSWIQGFMGRILGGLGAETNVERLVHLVAAGLPDEKLDGPPTPENMEEAFQRTIGRPVVSRWLEFWVGRPNATLRQVYRDLVMGEEFANRRRRMAEQYPLE